MKKYIITLTAAVLLASCAMQDKGGQKPGATDEDDNVMSVEQIDTVEVSKLYDGYEELQGKQIGEHLIMPDVIEAREIDNVYTFKLQDNYDSSDLVERGTEFYKRFFGDRFNADRLYYYDYGDDKELNSFSYNTNAETLLDGKPNEIYDPDNDDYGSYRGFPDNVKKTKKNTIDEEDTVIAEYDPVKDKDVVLELDGGKCTVWEICESVTDFFDREMTGIEGVKPIVSKLTYYSGTDRDKPFRRVYAECALDKEGIAIQSWFTFYWATNTTASGEEQTYYSPIYYNVILDGKDSILVFQSSALGPQKAYSVNNIENVISLKAATEILDENLAEKLLFKIEDVSLVYCRKVTNHPSGSVTIREFRPTWLFQFAGGKASLNVDAITGEITIDASVVTLNEMRSEQWK